MAFGTNKGLTRERTGSSKSIRVGSYLDCVIGIWLSLALGPLAERRLDGSKLVAFSPSEKRTRALGGPILQTKHLYNRELFSAAVRLANIPVRLPCLALANLSSDYK